MNPDIDPRLDDLGDDPANPQRADPTGRSALTAPPTIAEPGATGPRLGRIERFLAIDESILLTSPNESMVLCNPRNGACTLQGLVPGSNAQPVCVTSLRNGWLWGMGKGGEGISLCVEGCGKDYVAGEAPPLPSRDMEKLPTGATLTCGNARSGVNYWIGKHTMHRWGHRDASDVKALPGGGDDRLGGVVVSPGFLWLARGERLWARPWSARDGEGFFDKGSLAGDAEVWPSACAEAHRRVDGLVYVEPARRGFTRGFASGVWSIGPCGFVPLHLHDLEAGSRKAVLWPDAVRAAAAWPLPGKLSATVDALGRFFVVAPSQGSLSDTETARRPLRLWTGSARETSFIELHRDPTPVPQLAGIVQVDHQTYAVGDGIVELGTGRRVGLTHTGGQPFGFPRLHTRTENAKGTYHVAVTTEPTGFWLWKPNKIRPYHIKLADNRFPGDVEEIKFAPARSGGLGVAYRIDGTWYIQPVDLQIEPFALDAPPARLPEFENKQGDGQGAGAADSNDAVEEEDGSFDFSSVGIGALIAIAVIGGLYFGTRRR